MVEFHSHNDLGQAATNGLIAALSGASYIDTTLMGVGERAGNASLLDFVSLVEKTSSLSTPVTSAQAEEIEGTFREFLSRDEYVETLKISPDSDITQWISQHASH